MPSVSAPNTPSTTVTTFIHGSKAVAAAGTPERLVATTFAQRYVHSVQIYAHKSKAVANTGAVYVGFSSTAAENLIFRAQTDLTPIYFESAPGKVLDLASIWVDAATNDDAVAFTAIF